jgi:Aminopeptidase N
MLSNTSKKYSYLVIVILAFVQMGCANKRLAKNAIELEPIEIYAKTSGLYRAAATQAWDIEHTKVALSFNWKQKTADGQAWITLHPYFYPTDSLVLDAKSMKVDSVVLVGNGVYMPLKFEDGDSIKVKFDRNYTVKEHITLYIKYKAMPYAAPVGGSAAISEDRGLYFINTDYAIPGKPAQIWTQGETESNSHWMPTIDKPNSRFSFEISLTVPDSFTTLSNGSLLKQERDGKMRTDTWGISKPIQAYAAMFAIGKFAVVQDQPYNTEDLWPPVSYYVEPDYQQYAKDMFRGTPEMIAYFSEITGVPYPWAKYSQVVVRDYVSGAMENTSASLFGEFMNKNRREIADADNESIVAHELFHQWFGDYVTFESWSNLTLSESFATYGQQLWFNHKYGEAKADMEWYTNLKAYLGQAYSSDVPLLRYYYEDREKMFDRISYQKGAIILHYLHGLIGDEAFYRAMNIYLTRNALQSAEVAQWRMAVEEATGQDWNWFFNQWYYSGGHPELDIKYNYDDAAQQLQVVVTQKQDSGLYVLPLKTELIYGTDKVVVNWDVNKKKHVFTYPYRNGVAPLIIPDTRHWLVGTLTEDKRPSNWQQQFLASTDNILNKLNAMLTVRKQLDDTATQNIYNLALRDKDAVIREYGVQMILAYAKGKKWEDKWRSDVVFMAVNDADISVRAAAFELLGEWKVKSVKEEMLAAIGDSSYIVAAAALRALDEMKDDTAYALAKKVISINPKLDLQTVAWEIIAAKGRVEDYPIFERDAIRVYGHSKIGLSNALNIYLRNVYDTMMFRKTTELLVQTHNSESIATYRAPMGGYLIETANYYKKQVQDSRTNKEKNEAQQKLDTLKKSLYRMLADEPNEENKKQYRPYLKKIFGE